METNTTRWYETAYTYGGARVYANGLGKLTTSFGVSVPADGLLVRTDRSIGPVCFIREIPPKRGESALEYHRRLPGAHARFRAWQKAQDDAVRRDKLLGFGLAALVFGAAIAAACGLW